jgi:ribulose-bisphosphate carboxylase large chain
MGGHLDINSITECKLIDLEFTFYKRWAHPKFGISGIRKHTGVYNKPLLGGIVKPKIGVSPEILLDIIKAMCDNGVNFIKEDEIMSNPECCGINERLELIAPYMQKHYPNVIYSYCINSDYPYCVDRARLIAQYGGNSIHINIWNGLGIYKTLRELDLPLFIHFQKSGDKIFTAGGKFSIAWPVVCQLAGMMGVDFIHAGMWGGYSNDERLEDCISVLHQHQVMPALSCGMHPGLVNKTTELFGVDYMANVGGAIHGHPEGTGAGVRAMRQAIDGTFGQ